jgi:hypothetical protein
MNKPKCILFFLFLIAINIVIDGQNTIPATGGNATGTGGTLSYSVGQIVYSTLSGQNGKLAQGVQQPYEISVTTAIENTENIFVDYRVYPNPTRGLIKLNVGSSDYEKMRFRLYDINGVLLQDKKVEAMETEVSMENLTFSVYILKVIYNNREVKVFKIVKN